MRGAAATPLGARSALRRSRRRHRSRRRQCRQRHRQHRRRRHRRHHRHLRPRLRRRPHRSQPATLRLAASHALQVWRSSTRNNVRRLRAYCSSCMAGSPWSPMQGLLEAACTTAGCVGFISTSMRATVATPLGPRSALRRSRRRHCFHRSQRRQCHRQRRLCHHRRHHRHLRLRSRRRPRRSWPPTSWLAASRALQV